MGAVSSGVKQLHSELDLSIREDLLNAIINKDPVDRPLFASTRNGPTAENILVEWLSDTTSTFSADSHSDGETYTFSALADRTRQGNYCQLFITTFKVGRQLEKVNKAGITSEYAYQLERAMDTHGTNIEYALTYGTSASGASSTGTATAATLAGYDAYISTYSATGSASGTWTSAQLDSLMQDIASATTGKPTVVMMSPTLKRAASAFTVAADRNISVEDKRLLNSIGVYDGDFGIVKFMWNRWLSAANSPSDSYGRAFILDESTWEMRVLQTSDVEEIAPLGYYRAGAITTSLTLVALAESCNAKFLASNC